MTDAFDEAEIAGWGDVVPGATGIPSADLADDDLLRELQTIHATRHETFLHGPYQALWHHSQRMVELEQEYLRRYPREVDPNRLRPTQRTN